MTTSPAPQPAQIPYGVLFDMDGTLIDTEPYWHRSEKAIVTEFGHTYTEEEGLDLIGKSIDHAAHTIVARKQLPIAPEAFKERMIRGVLDIEAVEGVPWRPGARELLAALAEQGVPTGLVTSSYRRLILPMLEQAPEGSLRITVVAEDVGTATKPDPAPYVLGAQRLGLDPQRCIAIEDSPAGATSAMDAGCRTLAVPVTVALPDDPRLSFAESLTQVDAEVFARMLAGEVLDLRR